MQGSLAESVERAHADALLASFGAPKPPLRSKADWGLVALHLAAAFHRVAVAQDVLNFYARAAHSISQSFRTLALLDAALAGRDPRATAVGHYKEAIVIDPALAEAHYGLARLQQTAGQLHDARDGFARSLALRPHPAAPAEAHLHANALWEHAQIYEALGQPDTALIAYRKAVKLHGTFGVQHIRFAKFLRRQGLLAEAAEQYRRCMRYSHRYFPEFLLPPLAPKHAQEVRTMVDEIHALTSGEHIVFWQGAYFAVPEQYWPVSAGKMKRLARAPGRFSFARRPLRRATSIAALENAPAPPEAE